ncbi:MAG: hypothetical protein AB8F74_18090 [Saprospiraceae bacterium]
MKYLLLFSFLLSCGFSATAQKFIQMEKYGSAKVKKYYIGDELTYKLKEFPDTWTTSVIEDIVMEENLVIFSNRTVNLKELISIRSFEPARWSAPIAKNLYRFGLSWGVLSLLAPLAGTPLTWAAAIVPAVAFVTGFLLKKIFRHRTYKLGKKRWLRMLNMNQELRIGP